MATAKEKSMQSARLKWLVTFGRYFVNVLNLRSFASVVGHCIEFGGDKVTEQWLDGVRQAIADPKMRSILENGRTPQPENFMQDVAEALAKRSLRVANQTVDSAALVFSHSMLDGIVSDACQISFLAKPSDWHRFVHDRRVELVRLIKGKNNRALLNENAEAFVKQLSRESIRKRLERLQSVCAPKIKNGKLATAWLDLKKLDAFDELRHRIIHGDTFFKKKRFDVEGQIVFAFQAGISVLVLVDQAHRLLDRKNIGLPSARQGLRAFAFLRREFPEFLQVIENYAESLSNENSTD